MRAMELLFGARVETQSEKRHSLSTIILWATERAPAVLRDLTEAMVFPYSTRARAVTAFRTGFNTTKSRTIVDSVSTSVPIALRRMIHSIRTQDRMSCRTI